MIEQDIFDLFIETFPEVAEEMKEDRKKLEVIKNMNDEREGGMYKVKGV